MKKVKLLFLCPILIIGLGSFGLLFDYNKHMKYQSEKKQFSKVQIKTLIEDSNLNIRAIEVIDSVGVIYLTSNGELGVYYRQDLNIPKDLLDDFPVSLKYDSIIPNFRALSVNKNSGFGISIGSPALLYKLDVDIEKNRVVYKEDHPKAFYDSMEFWNAQEGIAIGDPTDDCMSVIITRNAGKHWEKLSCDDLPKAKEGEAAFAASDTNIAIIGDKTWVATGGKASRILFSPDKGNTWDVYETPIVQGIETTGMYSIDFYDEMNGFAIGGDYTKPADSSANKIRTTDGGKTWQLVAQNQSPGYRSCVQYVPNGKGKELVAIGFNGIDYSNDSGNTWSHLSDEGFYTIRFLNDTVAYAAGKGRLSKLTFTE
nr:oxidoreductase [uncultured Psychroserpens sp.]